MLQKQSLIKRIKIRHILWTLVLLAFGGVIGNRSDTLFIWSWDQVIKSITTSGWPWICTCIIILICFSIAWAWLNSKENLTKQQQEHDFLSNLDRTLDMLLPSTIFFPDFQTGIHKFIEQAFKIVTQNALSNVRRGLLLLPDAQRRNLVISDIHGWTDNNKNQKKFCIDPQTGFSERGIAGEAFIKRNTIIAHITLENGNVKWDEPSYRPSEDPLSPFHGSLICVPILVGETANDCLGILCFDSYNLNSFDSPIVKEILLLLARHIAIALLIHQGALNILKPRP